MSRRDFLLLAVLFEGALAAVALLLGWIFRVNPLATWAWTLDGLLWGLGATVPMLAAFLVSMRVRWTPLRRIRDFLVSHLAPLLDQCAWYDLILIALLAGLAEELLFRGFLQPAISRMAGSEAAGLLASNVAFGLVHSITPTYAILAGVIGTYLGGLFSLSHNLLSPVLTHALYDYVAFLVVVREWKEESGALQFPKTEKFDALNTDDSTHT